MNQSNLLITLCVTLITFNAQADTASTAKPDETAQLVIANFAQTVQHIISMAGRPNDREHLAAHGCGIVQNIANIAQQALKGVKLEGLTEEEIAALVYKKLIALNVHELIAPAVTEVATRHIIDK